MHGDSRPGSRAREPAGYPPGARASAGPRPRRVLLVGLLVAPALGLLAVLALLEGEPAAGGLAPAGAASPPQPAAGGAVLRVAPAPLQRASSPRAPDAGEEPSVPAAPGAGQGFAARYDGMSPADLTLALERLRHATDELVRERAAERFAAGLYVVQPDEFPAGFHDRPPAAGRVWPVSRVDAAAGSPQTQVTYVSEAEHPEPFALQDEYLYAASLLARRQRAGQ